MATRNSKIVIEPNNVCIGSAVIGGEIYVGSNVVWQVKAGNVIMRDRKNYSIMCLPMLHFGVAGTTQQLSGKVVSSRETKDGTTSIAYSPTSYSPGSNAKNQQSRSGSFIVTQNESNLPIDVYWDQEADSIVSTTTVLDRLVLSGGTHGKLSAAGQTVDYTCISGMSARLYFHLHYTWTSGESSDSDQQYADLQAGDYSLYSNSITASNRGTVEGGEIALSSMTVTATYTNGTSTISGTKTFDDFVQEANVKSGPIWDSLALTLYNHSDVPARGGTVSSTTYVANLNGHFSYTSGSTTATSTAVSPTMQWTPLVVSAKPASASGRTLAGTLNATATYDTFSDSQSLNIYQEANAIVDQWTEYDTTRPSSPVDRDYTMSIDPTSRTGIAYTGATITMTSVSAYHMQDIYYPWEHEVYKYTSDAVDRSELYHQNTTDPYCVSTQIDDSYTVSAGIQQWIHPSSDGRTITVDANSHTTQLIGQVTYTNSSDVSATATLSLTQNAAPANYIKVYDENETEVTEGTAINIGRYYNYVMYIESDIAWTMTYDVIPARVTIDTLSGQAGTTAVTVQTRRTLIDPEWDIVLTIVAGNAEREQILHIEGQEPEL